jgi:lipooligosaccharide transport system permease protein
LVTLILPRLVTFEGTGRRSAAVAERNVSALRSGPAYWLVILSGFFEPLLYLLSIGVGVGELVGDLTLPGG